MGFGVDGAEAVEELEFGHDVTMHEDGGRHGGYCPPSCDGGHFVEPLFQGELLAYLAIVSPEVSHDESQCKTLSERKSRWDGSPKGKDQIDDRSSY